MSLWRWIGAFAVLSAPVVSLSAPAGAGAPVASFIHLSDDEGLAHSDVRAITQDHEGYIWFGLRLGGLTRYEVMNSRSISTIRSTPTPSATKSSGRCWSIVGVRSGLVLKAALTAMIAPMMHSYITGTMQRSPTASRTMS
jgi:ligand-binding sensor domain-containing protein